MKGGASILSFSAGMSALVLSPQMARAQDVIEAQPGTSLFDQFRPVYHFLAREKWMNDPCAPYYDDATGWYHMFYQLNPASTVWGNMTWGHAVSQDQVTWTDRPNALSPFIDKWDHLGIFSGYAMPKAIDNKDTVFYTGVTALPIHWKLEYLYGEHVMYATTDDGGATWQKGREPLLEFPPAGLNVTGWRDPMPFHSQSLDALYGYNASEGSNYLLLAGGVVGAGPRVFLYHAADYVHWVYHGFLFAPEQDSTFSPSSESWGFNFETTMYREMTDDEGEVHHVLFLCAEADPHRYAVWTIGTFASGQSEIQSGPDPGRFVPRMVGVSDRSSWYANSLYTDRDGTHVIVGWITDATGQPAGQPQGWDGMLSLPREVDVTILRDILDVEAHLVGPGDWLVSDAHAVVCATGVVHTRKTLKTLGIKPLRHLQLLRNADAYERVGNVSVNATATVLQAADTSFELVAEVVDFDRRTQVGVQVRRSARGDEVTTIVYDDAKKRIVIDRSQSSTADCPVFTDNESQPIATAVWGHFYLYDLLTHADEHDDCQTRRETLRFHVFVDVSSVEVFVNDRFALSARVYPCATQTASDGIALVASGKATFANVQVWTEPKHAWPETRTVPT